MSPYQHGEVFVTEDGAETDLDLGHYERFTDVAAHQSDNVTSGRIYQTILNKERRGDYLGATVQVIPHVTQEIKNFVLADADDLDFMLIEIGGTVGDIEGLPFFEALRQLSQELERGRSLFIHATLLPYIAVAGEMKTKPTQHSVKELRSIGISPHILLCRCEHPISEEEKRKLALFCNVRESSVIEARDSASIYDVPLAYHANGLDREVLDHFGIKAEKIDLSRWHALSESLSRPEGKLRIAVVAKYAGLKDAYKSLIEALEHGAIANSVGVELVWVDADQLEKAEDPLHYLANIHGILVPGGFGVRGTEGKMRAARYAREKHVPYFGICLGMQLAIIESLRNVNAMSGAASTEFVEMPEEAVIGLMTEWDKDGKLIQRKAGDDLGGTMRLGAYPAKLTEGSLIAEIYGHTEIEERHRHRYEVNLAYKKAMEAAGLKISGVSPDGLLPEVVERDPDEHPWFVGVQYHPEFKSRPLKPHPLFAAFIGAALKQSRLV